MILQSSNEDYNNVSVYSGILVVILVLLNRDCQIYQILVLAQQQKNV